MALCVPLMPVNLVLTWVWLQLLYLPLPCTKQEQADTGDTSDTSGNIRQLLQRRYTELGPVTRHERAVLAMFLLLVTLWLTRSPGFVTGWEVLLPPGT